MGAKKLELVEEIAALSDEEAKLAAFELYVASDVISFSHIARRARRPIAVVRAWADDGNWVEVRARSKREKKEKILEVVGDISERRLFFLSVADEITKSLSKLAKDAYYKESLERQSRLIDALKEVYKLQETIYERLEL